MDEAENGVYREKKKNRFKLKLCERCVELTHPVMHMPCKKPRAQEVSVFNPRTREKRKKKKAL